MFDSFWGKKGGGQLQNKNIIGTVAHKLFVFNLFCVTLFWEIHCVKSFVEEFGIASVDNFV